MEDMAQGPRQSENLQVRVTPTLLNGVTKTAGERGLTVPDYVRSVLSEAIYGPTLAKTREKSRRGRKK